MTREVITVIRKDIDFIIEECKNNNLSSDVYSKLSKIDSLLILEQLNNEDIAIPKGFIKVHPIIRDEPMYISHQSIEDFGDGVIKIVSREYSIRIKESKKRIIEMLHGTE